MKIVYSDNANFKVNSPFRISLPDTADFVFNEGDGICLGCRDGKIVIDVYVMEDARKTHYYLAIPENQTTALLDTLFHESQLEIKEQSLVEAFNDHTLATSDIIDRYIVADSVVLTEQVIKDLEYKEKVEYVLSTVLDAKPDVVQVDVNTVTFVPNPFAV